MRPVADKPRYLTYQCRFCGNQERRYRIIAHVLKDHVPLDRVPYYCSWCNFRSLNQDSLIAHLKGYPNHKDEVARWGVPDYRKVLKKSANLIRIEELMFPVEKSGISATIQATNVFADKEEDLLSSGSTQLPEWLTVADMPESPSTLRQTSQKPAPEYVPTPRESSSMLSMPMLNFDALIDDTTMYDPFSFIQSGPPKQSLWSQASVITPTATVSSLPLSLPADLSSQTYKTTPRNTLVQPVQRTPHSVRRQRLTQSSTPLMDEVIEELGVLPTATDETDPLLREKESLTSKRPAEKRDSSPPPKRLCTAVQTEDACTSLIADAVSKCTAKICEALGEQLKVMQTMQAAMTKQLEDSARMERRATSILRLLEDNLKVRSEILPQERKKNSPVKRIKSVVSKK